MKRLKSIVLSIVACLISFSLVTCEQLTKTTENIASAEGYSLSSTSLFTAINCIEEINQLDGKMPAGDIGIFKEGYTIDYSDSSLSDGDGIEYILHFGPLNSSAPKGTIGGDGVYRAGKIVVSITGAWSEINTSFLATFSDFHTGDGSTMNEVKGKIGGTRKTSKSWQITFDKLLVQLNSTDAMQEITGNCEIVTTAGNQTIGLLDNSQDVFGNGSGVLPSGESYSWTIDPNIPLKQRMEFGCAQTFVKGLVKITNSADNSELQLDFDPYENEACDRVAKALIGRREFIFTIK